MKKKTVYIILFCLILCFIWGNSILSREVSGAISHFIADIFGGEQGATDEGHHFVRKLAHFTEFAALGAVYWLLSGEYTSDRAKRIFSAAFVGVFVPICDETLQIFSGRGPALTDVWIDVFGYSTGTCAVALAVYLISKRVKNRASRI